MQKAITAVLLVILASGLCSCTETHRMESDQLTGQLWLRPVQLNSFEGFYLDPSGKLFLVNIFSMTGDRWELAGDELTFWTHTERYPEPSASTWEVELEEDELELEAQEEDWEMDYFPESIGALAGSRWIGSYMKNPTATERGRKEAYIEFDTQQGRVNGCSGLNNFFGSFETEGPIGISFGPLGATRMAGPGLEYETLLFSHLEKVDTCLVVRDKLFLYAGTEILLAFEAE